MSLVSLRSNRLSLHQVMGYPLISFRSVEMSDKIWPEKNGGWLMGL